MITLSKSGSSVTFTFDENSGYLQNGTIAVPVNSLSLVIDDSDMATFRKSASNDIFVSARYEEFGMSKAELESWYKDNMVGETGGGGGVDSGTVQTMIDESISGKADTTAVTEAISEAVSGKADTTAVTASINAAVSGKVDTSVYTAYTAATDARFAEDELASGEAFNDLNNRVNELSGNAISSGEVQTLINESVSGKQDTLVSGTNIKTINNESLLGSGNIDIQGGVSESAFTAYTAATDERIAEDEEVTAAGINAINDAFTAYTASTDAVLSGKVNTSVYTAYTAATDARILEDEEVTAAGLNSLNDALSGKVDTSTYSAYTAATDAVLSGKQDTLSAGTNITISGNVISAEGGGGKAIEAGRGIAITTGATADTVSFNLPISGDTNYHSINEGMGTIASGQYTHAEGYYTTAGIGSYAHAEGVATKATGNASHAEGDTTRASGNSSHAEGWNTSAMTSYSHAEGYFTKTTNDYEHASGLYNVSNTGSTTSANTLFSVGNGTANNARHNAFEIRQNGDIYCSDGTNDVKLQDYLQIKVVKVTQAEYDALVQGGTVDANTLYIITNVVS